MPSPSNQAEPELTDISEEKLYAALSYMLVLVFVPLVMRKRDPFVRWHAKQGLVILVGLIIAVIAASWIPLVGNILVVLLLIAEVAGLLNALLGRRWKIPLIGDIAGKFEI